MRRAKLVCRPNLKAALSNKSNGPQIKKSIPESNEPPAKIPKLDIVPLSQSIKPNNENSNEILSSVSNSSQEVEFPSNVSLGSPESSEKENISENLKEVTPKDTSSTPSVIEKSLNDVIEASFEIVKSSPSQEVELPSNSDFNSPESSKNENASGNSQSVFPTPDEDSINYVPLESPNSNILLDQGVDEIDASMPVAPITLSHEKQTSILQDISKPESQDKSKGKKRKLSDASEAKIARARETRKNPEWIKRVDRMMKENRKQELKVADLLFYNPQHGPTMKHVENDRIIGHIDDDRDLTEPTSDAPMAPQLKLDENGDIVIDQDSLYIQSSQLGDLPSHYGTAKDYSKKKNSRKSWTNIETLKFYKILSRVGADFALMKEYFPKLTRNQLKNKYSLEQKKNPQLIQKTLAKQNFYTDDLEACSGESEDDVEAAEYEVENPM